MKSRRQYGFTKIELAVASAIVMLLLVPLLPAMQHARENSRRVMCMNNLKYLGLAIHNYHDVFNMMPPSWISKRMDGEGHASNGWQVMLLPYVDQAPLYNQLFMTHHIYENEDRKFLKTEIRLFHCPADSMPATNPLRGGWGSSSYSGSYGASPLPRWTSGYATQTYWPGQRPTPNPNRLEARELTGIFPGVNKGSRMRDITDGTSNTLLIGEKSVLSGGGIWPGPRSNFHESDVVSDASFASPFNRSETGFSSRHRGVVIFATADGAVHAIATDIDSRPYDPNKKQMGILQKLASRADGNVIGQF